MDPNNLGYSKDELNNFGVNEIIIKKVHLMKLVNIMRLK